ncbi:hypothetical protein NC651_025944 [Populus alba x Populus x berolinensis]|nr:hypothetical protein NC651_025944 [Populus alba x Populus x berolinensis]
MQMPPADGLLTISSNFIHRQGLNSSLLAMKSCLLVIRSGFLILYPALSPCIRLLFVLGSTMLRCQLLTPLESCKILCNRVLPGSSLPMAKSYLHPCSNFYVKPSHPFWSTHTLILATLRAWKTTSFSSLTLVSMTTTPPLPTLTCSLQ